MPTSGDRESSAGKYNITFK